MALSVYTGNGTTVTGNGLGGWAGKVISIGEFSESIDEIDVNYLGTTGHDNYIPGDLTHHSPVSMTVQFDPEDTPTLGSVNTITITFAGGATIAGTGFVTAHGWNNIANNERIEGTLTFRWDGDTGPTYTAAP